MPKISISHFFDHWLTDWRADSLTLPLVSTASGSPTGYYASIHRTCWNVKPSINSVITYLRVCFFRSLILWCKTFMWFRNASKSSFAYSPAKKSIYQKQLYLEKINLKRRHLKLEEKIFLEQDFWISGLTDLWWNDRDGNYIILSSWKKYEINNLAKCAFIN